MYHFQGSRSRATQNTPVAAIATRHVTRAAAPTPPHHAFSIKTGTPQGSTQNPENKTSTTMALLSSSLLVALSNATLAAASAAAVLAPHSPWRNGSFDHPTTLSGRLIQGVKLFGEAIAEQGAQLQPRTVAWDRFGSLAAYAFSAYGVTTFFVALILNRTATLASLASTRVRRASGHGAWALFRRSPVPQGAVLAAFRALAIVLLATQAFRVLVALSVHGHNAAALDACRLARLLPQRYFAYDAATYDGDVYMQMPRNEVIFGPTTAMLWPVFLAVSYSLFVETLAAASCGKRPFLDGGLTLFELSLALQELSPGFAFFGAVAKRPTEQVLVVCLFALADHIASQAGAVLYQNRYRLVPLSLLSGLFVWYFCTFLPGRIFAMPLEIALTYLALVATLAVTAACGLVLLLTLITKGARVDELNIAHLFNDADTSGLAQHLGVDLSQDFYTAAINVGMLAVSHAGRASYFAACSAVPCPQHTWLETRLLQASKGADGLLGLNCALLSGSGYDTIIKTPSRDLISGDNSVEGVRVGTIKLRLLYLAETMRRFFQLVQWSLLHVVYYWPKERIFMLLGRYKDPRGRQEQANEHQSGWAYAPPFVREMIDKEERALEHVMMGAKSEDVLEEDDSPDFELVGSWEVDSEEGSDSELDSEAELIDSSHANSVIPKLTETYSSAIAELMTSETLIEIFKDKDILHEHLQYEYKDCGMMTRSRYRALNAEKSTENQTKELFDLILTKRRAQMHREASMIEDDIDPRMACVICQTEPRTLITWPCKCFAICEGCRVSLVAKGMKGCVCCRQDVEGVSRVFMP